jgi:hypothetical protein
MTYCHMYYISTPTHNAMFGKSQKRNKKKAVSLYSDTAEDDSKLFGPSQILNANIIVIPGATKVRPRHIFTFQQ